MRTALAALSLTLATLGAATLSPPSLAAEPVNVKMETSRGDIVLALDAERAPVSVKNFVDYARAGHYDGTTFHRVIKGFMIQGGGYDATPTGYVERPTRAPIVNEARNGLKNARGTVAMARTGDPNSATAQFFINHANNDNLDYPSFDGYGYAVFGRVTQGMDVVDAIARAPTCALPPFGQDVPCSPITIRKVTVINGPAGPAPAAPTVTTTTTVTTQAGAGAGNGTGAAADAATTHTTVRPSAKRHRPH